MLLHQTVSGGMVEPSMDNCRAAIFLAVLAPTLQAAPGYGSLQAEAAYDASDRLVECVFLLCATPVRVFSGVVRGLSKVVFVFLVLL